MERADSEPLRESFDRVQQRLEPLRRLHGPIEAIGEGTVLEAYYARWRSAAGMIAARLRRLDSAPFESTPNRV
jgi:hypothetical protein